MTDNEKIQISRARSLVKLHLWNAVAMARMQIYSFDYTDREILKADLEENARIYLNGAMDFAQAVADKSIAPEVLLQALEEMQAHTSEHWRQSAAWLAGYTAGKVWRRRVSTFFRRLFGLPLNRKIR